MAVAVGFARSGMQVNCKSLRPQSRAERLRRHRYKRGVLCTLSLESCPFSSNHQAPHTQPPTSVTESRRLEIPTIPGSSLTSILLRKEVLDTYSGTTALPASTPSNCSPATCSVKTTPQTTMVGLEVPTDIITNHPVLPRFLSSRRISPHVKRLYIPTTAMHPNPTPLRPAPLPRNADSAIRHWPEWARLVFVIGLGLAALLLIVLLALLCARRRQRAGMTTVAQKEDPAAYASTNASVISQPMIDPPQRTMNAMAPPRRPLLAAGLTSPNGGMYDVPLDTGVGGRPPFGADMAWRDEGHAGPQRSIGTGSVAGRGAAQGESAFSPWDSPTRKKFKF